MYVVGSANFWFLSLEKKHFVHNFFKGEISESIVYLQDNVTTTKDKKSDKKKWYFWQIEKVVVQQVIKIELFRRLTQKVSFLTRSYQWKWNLIS